MAQTMAELLIEKGIEQGNQLAIQLGLELVIEEGIEQGIEQGKIQAKQAIILKVLRFRFDAVPDSFSSEINSIRNLPRLDALFEKALTAKTLDEIDLQNHDS